VAPLVSELQLRRDVAVEALGQIGLPVEPPKGAMYLWVPLPGDRRIKSHDFARVALEQQNTLVLPGAGFGPAGEGYFRIALATGPERLRQAILRLAPALEQAARSGAARV